MQVNQRRAGILLNYVGEAIKILTALIYTPVMLRLLGQSEYGLYQLVSSTVSYLSLLSLGFGSAYVRYHARYRVVNDNAGIARLNGMFLSIFGVMSAVCLLCGGAMVAHAPVIFGDGLTAPELEKAKILLTILVVNMALTFPNSVFNCYVTAHEKFVFQKLVMVAQSLMNPFITLPLLLAGYDSVAMVLVTTVLTVACLMVNLYVCLKKMGMKFTFRGMEFSLLREMAAFTFFIFLNQIIDQVNWSVDKFLLGRMAGTTAVAVYGIGGQINSLYIQVSTSISSVFAPQIHKMVASSNCDKELTQLMIRVGRIQFLPVMLVFTGFLLFGKSFIWLWAGEDFQESYWVALLLMLPMVVPLIQNIGIEIQRAKNMHRFRSIVYTCMAGSNLLLSIVLVYKWGSIGAAAGTTFTLFVSTAVFMNWYYHKRIGLDMRQFWKSIAGFIPAIMVSLVFGAVYCCIVDVKGWLSLAVSVLMYTVVYATAMWFLAMNQYEKELVMRLIAKSIRKIR